jgi:hypothetical protein
VRPPYQRPSLKPQRTLSPLERAILKFNTSHIVIFSANSRVVFLTDWRKYIETNGKARIQKGWLTYNDLSELVKVEGGIARNEPLFVVRVIGEEDGT